MRIEKDIQVTSTAREFTVSGRVQGVGFRWFVLRRARSLEITGWVKNCSDGSVEIRAEGTQAALESLESLLNKGPAGSMVQQVLSRDAGTVRRYQEFDIVY